jgi:hypothetical protein
MSLTLLELNDRLLSGFDPRRSRYVEAAAGRSRGRLPVAYAG